MKSFLYEQWQRILDRFYLFFGTDEYLEEKEPTLLYDKWICKSVEWQLFKTHHEARQALESIGKEVV